MSVIASVFQETCQQDRGKLLLQTVVNDMALGRGHEIVVQQ